jgi:uncharacterized FAD-dependent dehydrogenase
MEAPIAMETTIDTDTLILAIGHSARDSYECLLSAGLHLRQKPFSIGLRIEHRQTSIDAGQYGVDFEKTYGMDVRAAGLPPAEYKLSWRGEDGRGVYSFCMCPGGEVIACASEQGGIFSNGMSYGARSGAFANSAILVDVRTEDFASTSPLAGLDFRRIYERQAFALSAQVRAASAQPAGGSPSPVPSTASAASVPCALPAFPCAASARPTGDAPHMSAAPSHKARLLPSERVAGFLGADSLLASCLPEFAVRGIRTALPRFGRKLQGFDAPDAWLYGPETRSSSPVRIPRDEDGMANIPGVFPAGEGAGYAGGIMSAAVDGLRAAQAVIARSCASRGSSS